MSPTMSRFLILLLLCTSVYARDPAQVRNFRKDNPCPATGQTTGACPGYVVDHMIPLCAGGLDDPVNMHWQKLADSKKKDAQERALCAKLKCTLRTMTVTTAINQNNLGPNVSTRTINWLDMAIRAWGEEWSMPDHNIYEFNNGRKFDSTDRGLTGVYGVQILQSLEENSELADMDHTLSMDDSSELLYISPP